MSHHLPPLRLALLASQAEPTDAEAEHLLDCASCRDALDDVVPHAGLAAATAELRATAPLAPEAQARVEQRLLTSLRRRRLAPVGAAAAAVLALAAGWALVRPSPPPAPASHASVELAASSHVQNLPTASSSDELLALDGEAQFRVRPLPSGHRFRVRVGSDEVEVKGTTFRLVSGPTGLVLVEVTEGVVEVRTSCCGTRQLTAGQQWAPTAVASASPPKPGTLPEAPPPDATASTSALPTAPGPGVHSTESAEDLRRRGVAAFDTGSYAAAAAALDRAIALDPQAPWARDARTLAGSARVLASPPEGIASLGVGVASFDKAANLATARGDSARAAAARLGAARQLKGSARKQRYCALVGNSALSAAAKLEAERECAR